MKQGGKGWVSAQTSCGTERLTPEQKLDLPITAVDLPLSHAHQTRSWSGVKTSFS